jgi:predicted acyl esterase
MRRALLAVGLLIVAAMAYVAAFHRAQFPYRSSGTAAGERQLVGPQTTGRAYRNLSQPEFAIRAEYDLEIPLRDGTKLRADLYRPATDRRVPVLVAASPYPRQAQYLSAPAGFIEAGQTDFWVPRGYAHLIVNVRGTHGSGGSYRFLDPHAGQDLYDVIEWSARQPWSDGNTGMIGVSYFSMEQYHAALAKPPHLKAIFPFSGATDPYRQIMYHGGILQGRFAGSYFNANGVLEKLGGDTFRALPFRVFNNLVLHRTAVHGRFATPPKAPMDALEAIARFSYEREPWESNYAQIVREHQLYDDFWASRDVTERIGGIDVPMYLGSDPENVSIHLDGPFAVLPYLRKDQAWQVMLTPRGGLQWPWESMHVEALAWYDHWLKGRDTGILEGPRIRYYVEGVGEWRATERWPLPHTQWRRLFLAADGKLSAAAAGAGNRDYIHVPPNLPRGRGTLSSSLPAVIAWESDALAAPVELIGPFVLHLLAASTATDTDWIVKLLDVAPDGTALNLTQGWLRASHRALDARRSRPYRPVPAGTKPQPLEPGKPTGFDIAILPLARRFQPGHRLRLELTSADTPAFAMQGQSHAPIGIPARNSVFAGSYLTIPLAAGNLGSPAIAER